MPDSDWVRYKKLRGSPPPETVQVAGSRYERLRLLKLDFYAGTALYQRVEGDGPEQVLVKIYHEDRLGLIPLGWLGRLLAGREAHYLGKVTDVVGTTRLLHRLGRAGLVREYAPGVDLREFGRAARPNAEFFPKLAATLAAVHARGVAHNDLSKPENVLVTPDGDPILIDFQIALGLPRLGRPILRYLQGVDRYHLGKLHRRHRPDDFTAAERDKMRRKGPLLALHGWLLRRPYRAVRHLIMNRFLLKAGAPPPARSAGPHRRSAGRGPRAAKPL